MNEELSFLMAGSGNWRKWFPERAGEFYLNCYGASCAVSDLSESKREVVAGWESAGFVSVTDGNIQVSCPILTMGDLQVLQGWFYESSGAAAEIIESNMPAYEVLVERLSDGPVGRGALLPILVYAQTLDLGTLMDLERGIMGAPPARADSGSYFFWGQTVSMAGRLYYGVNSFGTDHFIPRYIWSHRFERRAQNRKSITIPVFDAEAMDQIRAVCGGVAGQLAQQFASRLSDLDDLLPSTTFAACHLPDVYCMLFHWGYSEIADALIRKGIMPTFPENADDGWGFWVEWE